MKQNNIQKIIKILKIINNMNEEGKTRKMMINKYSCLYARESICCKLFVSLDLYFSIQNLQENKYKPADVCVDRKEDIKNVIFEEDNTVSGDTKKQNMQV